MWNAFATCNGDNVYDWENKCVADPALAAVFQQANQELFRQSGMTNPEMLALGWIAMAKHASH